MANRIINQTLVDTSKRTLHKTIIVADGTATSNVPLISFNSLVGAINATGQVSNTNPKSNYSVSIKRIWGHCSKNTGGHWMLRWNSASNTEIVSVGSGMFDYNLSIGADNGVIKSPDANNAGIGVSAVTPGNDALTIFIELRKDNHDFDAGQSADPTAFNVKPQ